MMERRETTGGGVRWGGNDLCCDGGAGRGRALIPMKVKIRIQGFGEPLKIPHLCLLLFFQALVKTATHKLLCMNRIFVKILKLNSWLDTS